MGAVKGEQTGVITISIPPSSPVAIPVAGEEDRFGALFHADMSNLMAAAEKAFVSIRGKAAESETYILTLLLSGSSEGILEEVGGMRRHVSLSLCKSGREGDHRCYVSRIPIA